MKGFVKILEAIIASIILLASLTFFFIPNVQKSGWDDVALNVLAHDALETAYLNGTISRFVKSDDTTPLIDSISSMLPQTVDFSIEVNGLPNKIILIACVDCPQSGANSADDLSSILFPNEFTYKRQNISIRVGTINLATENIPDNTNILFFFDKTKISTYQTKINDFLNKGGSVFLLSEIIQTDVNGPIGSIFNLGWVGITSLPGKFDDVNDAKKVSHFVARYYANISTRHLQNVQSETFTVFKPSGVTASNDNNNVVKSDDGRAYVRTNYTNNGRSVWFSEYTRSDHNNPNTKAIDNLTKASIMWASGERFKLDKIKKMPAPVNFRSSLFVVDEDTYLVELIVWRIFF